jgi:RNA polymerase sigma-70 factor (ECF subfamily)
LLVGAQEHAGAELPSPDMVVLHRLRAGDDAAFASLVDAYGASLGRIARLYVADRAAADEVVQDTWLALLESLDRFEGRCSLKTWIFRILTNCARRKGVHERRDIPFSALGHSPGEDPEPSVAPNRFLDSTARWPGHWAAPPAAWDELPEDRLLSMETRAHVSGAIETLPPAQREVITLRDVEGWSSAEVCDALGISEANQRVLLHRARSKVRAALESYLERPS